MAGRSVIRRLNITLEGQVITPIARLATPGPQTNGSGKRGPGCSLSPGLNGSTAAGGRLVHGHSSFNASVSMLTPPSSPPPPVPANQSPAVLRQQRSQVAWSNGKEKPALRPADKPKTPVSPPRVKTPVSPPRAKTPVPAPRTQLSPVVSVPKPAARTPTSPTSPPALKGPKKQNEEVVVVVMREKRRPRREEARKSFVEIVAEIPFADDVDDNFDERTPETSLDKFYTPPTSRPDRERPPLHLALAMENGKPNIPKVPRATQFSPEAKEIAEERMRAREKSIKSQALKDAMSKQLHKMKESDAAKGASAKVAWSGAVDDAPVGKGKKPAARSPNTSAVKALESKKAEALPERLFNNNSSSSKSPDGSAASSDGSAAAAGKSSKKRSSLFSPRKSKKEKKAKNEAGRLSGADETTTPTPPKHKSLWKAVFSGYKKDKKKKSEEKSSCPSTPSSSSTTQDSGTKTTTPKMKTATTTSPDRRSSGKIVPPRLSLRFILFYGSLSALVDFIAPIRVSLSPRWNSFRRKLQHLSFCLWQT